MTTITIPISRRVLMWCGLIGFPIMTIVGIIGITADMALNALMFATGIICSMFIWFWAILTWADEYKFPTIKFRCD